MKLMYPERHGAPTASSADANYPVANLIDDRRKKVWKAASIVRIATLRVPISANSEAISVHATNAWTVVCAITLDSVEVQLTDGQPAVNLGGGLTKIPASGHGLSEGDIAVVNGTDYYDGVHTLPSQAGAAPDAPNNFVITATYNAETFSNTDIVCKVIESTTHTLDDGIKLYAYDRFWQEYTKQVAAHTATIILTAGVGETVEAGIVRAGMVVDLPSPLVGLGEGREDFSIKKQLNNGAWYIRKRDIVRSFGLSAVMDRATEFADFTAIYEHYGPNPLCFLLVEDSNELLWAFFGHMLNPFSSSHGHPSDVDVTVDLMEAV